VVDHLGLPLDVEEDAAWIYRKALKQDLVRGRSIHAIAIASLYAACRLTGIPRNLQAFVLAGIGNRKEISRCYRLLQHELALSMPIDEPMKFVPLIASKTQIHQQTQNRALELLRKAHKQQVLTGKNPAGLAAAALYIASIHSEKKATQKRLAQAAGVTEVTVRNLYKRLKNDLEISELLAIHRA
jgi:transcription initiation factor TFIIB